ncbi:helix-turn-helix domain-containing protein, partial [Nanoarchaeota archaeon]
KERKKDPLVIPNKKMRGKKSKGISFLLTINNSSFGRILFCLGAPIGNKTKTEFLIPSWIRNSKTAQKYFLQALLEDELATIKIEKVHYCNKARFNMTKILPLKKNLCIFLNQVRSLIESFAVSCSKLHKLPYQESEKVAYYFFIQRNKQNIINFAENIGFRFHPKKIKHLKNAHQILKKTFRPKIDRELVLKLRSEGLTMPKIAEKLKISKSSVHRILADVKA